jgi:hypothetical protein
VIQSAVFSCHVIAGTVTPPLIYYHKHFLMQIWLIVVDKLKGFARRYIVLLNLILHGDGV